MYKKFEEDPLFSQYNFGNWWLLSFVAGSVNVGGFMACQRFVTHVTGFASLFGADAAIGNWHQAFAMLTIPLYFLLGSMVSSVLVDRRIQAGKTPKYEVAMLLVAACFAAAAIFGELGVFGKFGLGLELERDYLLLALLCGGSGLQNALISSRSSSIVRTTHLTGITTDLGIGLVRVFFHAKNVHPSRGEVRANWLRFGTILSFVLGSFMGAMLYLRFGYLGFFMPACIATTEVILEFALHRRRTMS